MARSQLWKLRRRQIWRLIIRLLRLESKQQEQLVPLIRLAAPVKQLSKVVHKHFQSVESLPLKQRRHSLLKWTLQTPSKQKRTRSFLMIASLTTCRSTTWSAVTSCLGANTRTKWTRSWPCSATSPSFPNSARASRLRKKRSWSSRESLNGSLMTKLISAAGSTKRSSNLNSKLKKWRKRPAWARRPVKRFKTWTDFWKKSES